MKNIDKDQTERRGPLSRREIMTGAIGAGVALGLHGGPDAQASQAGPARRQRPNVIFIMTDQLTYDALGCNGSRDAITPHLDGMAREGVRFESCYVAQPVCAPARSSILTGMYPHATGVIENGIPLLDHSRAFPRVLHDSGYRTAYIGKWHLGPGRGTEVAPPPAYFNLWKGYETGVSHWVGGCGEYGSVLKCVPPIVDFNSDDIPNFEGTNPGEYRTDRETDEAIRFIRGNADQQFCVFLSFYPPHGFWTAPMENCLRFKGRVKYPTYHAMVNRIDENVGRLLRTLDEMNLRNDTLLVFTTDHGYNFVPQWNEREKQVCYDTASRVPLIMSWKGKMPAATFRQVFSHVDLAPTILSLCGVPVPAGYHGHDAAPILLRGDGPWRDYVVVENRPIADINSGTYERCVVTNEWKLILNSAPTVEGTNGRNPELYSRREAENTEHNLLPVRRVLRSGDGLAHVEGGFARDPAMEKVKRDLYQKLAAWGRETGDGSAVYLLRRWGYSN